MKITDFIKNYNNHPILFIGSGFSMRYLKNFYNWEGLLKRVSFDLKGTDEYFLDIKQDCYENGKYDYSKIASILEDEFERTLRQNRNGKFEEINDMFYELANKNISVSRMKIYITKLLSNIEYLPNVEEEITALKKVRKNIGSIITTNYDQLIEDIFQFNPLIGNDILLSNPYGSIYKIHGCITSPENIIITDGDYKRFDQKYELIRAQLLSLFIHNPIIFIGYSITDENVRKILKTIFSYIDKDSEMAERIRNNFLLVEFQKGSYNQEVFEHDIVLDSNTTITVNKLRTDDYLCLYNALSDLQLPISAMDIRKVQSIVKEIYSGGDIKVKITDDIDSLNNSEKVVAIGNVNRINYVYHSIPEIMQKYFEIIDEENMQILNLINKQKIQSNQFFPIFGFSKINSEIDNLAVLKENQKKKMHDIKKKCSLSDIEGYNTISEIIVDDDIAKYRKINCISIGLLKGKFNLDECKDYLLKFTDKKCTDYRKLLCVYDYVKYSEECVVK